MKKLIGVLKLKAIKVTKKIRCFSKSNFRNITRFNKIKKT